jgi:uncharacterized protein (DUF4415 family)
VADDPNGSRDGAGKIKVSLALDQHTLEKLKRSGPDWQRRVNDILRQALSGEAEKL